MCYVQRLNNNKIINAKIILKLIQINRHMRNRKHKYQRNKNHRFSMNFRKMSRDIDWHYGNLWHSLWLCLQPSMSAGRQGVSVSQSLVFLVCGKAFFEACNESVIPVA